MRRVLIPFLAMLAFAAPVPVLATQGMCIEAMPMVASIDHGTNRGSCCDGKHGACMLACNAACTGALMAPAEPARLGDAARTAIPSGASAAFTVADIGRGLERPPRPVD